jgi:hypothetical protein
MLASVDMIGKEYIELEVDWEWFLKMGLIPSLLHPDIGHQDQTHHLRFYILPISSLTQLFFYDS